jgi:hypothetical protein
MKAAMPVPACSPSFGSIQPRRSERLVSARLLNNPAAATRTAGVRLRDEDGRIAAIECPPPDVPMGLLRFGRLSRESAPTANCPQSSSISAHRTDLPFGGGMVPPIPTRRKDMLTVKTLVLKVAIDVVTHQILDLASAIAEAEIRAAGYFCQSDEDWLISKYAVLPMREELAKLKTIRAELEARSGA